MKLGEAKFKLEQLRLLLSSNQQQLLHGPKENITQVLDICNDVLKEQKRLKELILKTECSSSIGSNNFTEITSALEIVTEKINILEFLVTRKDLGEEEKISITKQLDNYRSTRDTLKSTVNQYLWEITLLVE